MNRTVITPVIEYQTHDSIYMNKPLFLLRYEILDDRKNSKRSKRHSNW